MICILSSSHYVIAQSKAFFFLFAFKIYLRRQSVTSFFCGAPPPEKNPGSAPVYRCYGVGVGCGAIIGGRGWVWGYNRC